MRIRYTYAMITNVFFERLLVEIFPVKGVME